MANTHSEKRKVRATVVKSKKPGGKAHQRRAHLRNTRIKDTTDKTSTQNKPGMAAATQALAATYAPIKTGKYAKQLDPLLDKLYETIEHYNAGNGIARKIPWDENYGPVYRVGKQSYVQTDTSPAMTRGFIGENNLLIDQKTSLLQAELQHVVPSGWGTVEDWKSLGKEIRPEELSNGAELEETRQIPAGTVMYNASQTVGYEPLPDYLGEDTISKTDIMIGMLHSRLDIPIGRSYVSGYYPGEDIVTMLPENLYGSPMDYLGVLAHEMGHATGHTSRVNRPLFQNLETGEQACEKDQDTEELIAELTSVIVTQKLIDAFSFASGEPKTYPDEMLKGNAQYLFTQMIPPHEELNNLQYAIEEAEKASDWILSKILPNHQ